LDVCSNARRRVWLDVLAALAAWIIGRWLIGIALNLFTRALTAGKKVDATLSNYLRAILSVMLTMVLILAIFDIFRVKTTSFAALLAGAGLAIGTAWGGLLTHFAAGVFMQVLRPFKVGDFVQAGGVTGTVTEIEILQFTPEGPLLAVRPYCHTDHHWQVYFDTHKAIVTTFGAAGYPVPETPITSRNVSVRCTRTSGRASAALTSPRTSARCTSRCTWSW
jgi:small-conductance mechanosensitive channel